MRDSSRRSEKYGKKIRGLVLPEQTQHLAQKLGRQVAIEQAVNRIVGPDINRVHYMIFGKEIEKVLSKYKAEIANTEVCILENKWAARGLNRIVLNSIEDYFNVKHCTVGPPCSSWETEEECEGAGCYWYNGSCHSEEAICTDYDNEPECVAAGCYWYDGSCHSEAPPCPEDWCDTAWRYRKPVIVNHVFVDGSQTDYPILIDITDADMAAKAKADGSDIKFCDEDGNPLVREIECWTKATGKLSAWVKIPTMPSNVDTTIYMYYGNAAGAEVNSTAVWSNGFNMVQHMYDNPNTSTITDSTASAITGAKTGAKTSANNPAEVTTGLPCKCQAWDATSERIALGTPAGLTMTNNFTVELWFNRSWASDGELFVMYETGWYDYSEGYAISKVTTLGILASTQGVDLIPGITSGSGWNYLAITFSSTAGKDFWHQGNSVAHNAGVLDVPAITHNINIGNAVGRNFGLMGREEEVRVSNVVRSSGWIKTTYNCISNNAAFISIDPEEECVT